MSETLPRQRTVTRAIQGVADPDPQIQAESTAILIKVILAQLVHFAASLRLFGGMEVEHLLNDLACDVWKRIRERRNKFESRAALFAYLYKALGNRKKSKPTATRRSAPPEELESLLDTTNPDPEELESCSQFLEALETRLKAEEVAVLKAIIQGYQPREIQTRMGMGEYAYRVVVTGLRKKVRTLRPDAPSQSTGRPSGKEGPQDFAMEDPSQSVAEVMRDAVMGFLAAANDAPPVLSDS